MAEALVWNPNLTKADEPVQSQTEIKRREQALFPSFLHDGDCYNCVVDSDCCEPYNETRNRTTDAIRECVREKLG